MTDDDLPLTPAEQAAHARLVAQLEAGRVAPSPQFRASLGVAVERDAARRHLHVRPSALWLRAGVLCGGGLALLGLAALQL